MDISLNLKLINERLSAIRASGIRMQRLIALGRSNFVADPDNFAITEHHLRRSLEAILDIGRHIIAKKGWGAPKDYSSILLTLGQRGILPQTFAQRVQGMAGYRNRLVHAYADVSPEEIYDLLVKHLEDFAEFNALIFAFLERD
ncbi:MAG: hypothetical protein DDT37_01186 [Firmicutes bacterium]|nr:hypothetical protein [candidate division NPL-UPA2 bacterium]MBT9153702.1 hypothetical protein [candidate division NPL-UPA2 bacterium]MBT9156202.1 hypothetical protein [candidate division NPL-UPA2 bacterium]